LDYVLTIVRSWARAVRIYYYSPDRTASIRRHLAATADSAGRRYSGSTRFYRPIASRVHHSSWMLGPCARYLSSLPTSLERSNDSQKDLAIASWGRSLMPIFALDARSSAKITDERLASRRRKCTLVDELSMDEARAGETVGHNPVAKAFTTCFNASTCSPAF